MLNENFKVDFAFFITSFYCWLHTAENTHL